MLGNDGFKRSFSPQCRSELRAQAVQAMLRFILLVALGLQRLADGCDLGSQPIHALGDSFKLQSKLSTLATKRFDLRGR